MIYELLVLFHNGGQSSQDECCGWRLGDIEGAFLELMMILMSFQNMSEAFLDVSIEVKKGGYI